VNFLFGSVKYRLPDMKFRAHIVMHLTCDQPGRWAIVYI